MNLREKSLRQRVIGIQKQKMHDDFMEQEVTVHGGDFNVGTTEGETMPQPEFPYLEWKSWLPKRDWGYRQWPAASPKSPRDPQLQIFLLDLCPVTQWRSREGCSSPYNALLGWPMRFRTVSPLRGDTLPLPQITMLSLQLIPRQSQLSS